MRVQWTPGAQADLLGIIREIARDRQDTARKVAQTIRSSTRELSDQPQIGRMVEEFSNEHIRERIVRPWRVIYRVLPEEIHVLAVVRSRRTLTNRNIGHTDEP